MDEVEKKFDEKKPKKYPQKKKWRWNHILFIVIECSLG